MTPKASSTSRLPACAWPPPPGAKGGGSLGGVADALHVLASADAVAREDGGHLFGGGARRASSSSSSSSTTTALAAAAVAARLSSAAAASSEADMVGGGPPTVDELHLKNVVLALMAAVARGQTDVAAALLPPAAALLGLAGTEFRELRKLLVAAGGGQQHTRGVGVGGFQLPANFAESVIGSWFGGSSAS